MADRPHRKATLKQLVKLSEEYWSAPRELAEILAELRQRDDPDAQPVIRSIVRRLSVLNYKPPAPTDESGAPAGRTRAEEEEARRRRRRLLIATAPLGAAAAVAAWLLWADRQPPAPPGEATAGLDLKAHGALLDRQRGATLRRGNVVEDLRSPAMAFAQRGEPAPTARGRQRELALTPAASPPLHGPTASIFVMLPPPGAPPTADIDLIDNLGPNILNGHTRRAAEEGIYIGQARLRCYLTDKDPESCGRNLWGGNTRPGPMGRQPSDIEELRAAQAEFGHTRPPDVPRATLARTSAPQPPGPSRDQPRQAPRPRGREPSDAAGRRPSCPAPQTGRTVFVLDGSLSMGLPLWVGAELEDQLDEGVEKHDPDARRHYRELLATPGPKRITRAREAFTAAAGELPSRGELGLVVFRECKDIRQVGIFPAEQRPRAIDYVRSLIPRGRTPIAQSLRAAAEMLDDGPTTIVLLTDGRESCSGDPCAAAAEIHAQHPGTPINVVDISGQAKAECIATATGGRVYAPDAADDLGRVLANAFRGADPNCPVTGENGSADTARAR
ncbi:MAG: VWA domain-containing protein [Alphaproteobacteria bacterium]|nr:VWA domain-containing protein [Alphaproteobacteria bacterium]